MICKYNVPCLYVLMSLYFEIQAKYSKNVTSQSLYVELKSLWLKLEELNLTFSALKKDIFVL